MNRGKGVIRMKIHIVQKGETLWEIAEYYEVDFEKLLEANPQISSADMIMPGMKIMIPQQSKTVVKETKKQEKNLEIKPLKMKEDDHKEKPILNMSTPALDSMKLPVIENPEAGEIKQKEEIKAQFKQEQSPSKPTLEQNMPYPYQKAYFHSPHCCYCCPYQNHFRQKQQVPFYYPGETYEEPRYTGHLSGFYDYSPSPREGLPNPQVGPYPTHNHYIPGIEDPKLPNLKGKDQK